MKLNYKRTILVGFAFFLISVFWQAYDSIIPKILTDKFGLNQFWSGIIMALDNVLAVVLLPIFGALSDKCRSKQGRRTPFILIGTLVAAIAFVGLSVTDNMQLAELSPVAAVTDSANGRYTDAMDELYREAPTVRVDGETVVLSEQFTAEQFRALEPGSEYVIAARQAYAWQKTLENPVTLVFFIVLLLAVLLAMATFRSPAVALMPDVTPKPLRSKANAIINLMGSAGGILVLILGMVFGTGKAANALMSYTTFFMVTSLIMLAALTVFRLTVKEPRWAQEAQAACPEQEEPVEAAAGKKEALTGKKLRSLLFILASVVLWFMGYNAVTSKYSVYAGQVLGLDYNLTLIVAQAAAIVAYLPVGMVASKIGRKKTILAGIVMLGTSFLCASFMRQGSNIWVMNGLFALAGIGWATINVNSYPMVVELAKSGDVGKYTGFYYTASMSAQIITPVISGAIMTAVGMTSLFPYATVFVALAFVTMLFVRHGDSRLIAKKGLEAFDVED